MSLKAKIRNYAKKNGIAAQVVLQNYMFERFLVRLSRSEYKDKFVVKGGVMITAIAGAFSTSPRNRPQRNQKKRKTRRQRLRKISDLELIQELARRLLGRKGENHFRELTKMVEVP